MIGRAGAEPRERGQCASGGGIRGDRRHAADARRFDARRRGGLHGHDAAHPDGSGGTRPTDRLRERGQPVPGPQPGPAPGNRHPVGPGFRSGAAGAPVLRRKPARSDAGRRGGPGRRAPRCPVPPLDQSGSSSACPGSRTGRPAPPVRRRGDRAHGASVRPRPGPARLPGGPDLRPARRLARHSGGQAIDAHPHSSRGHAGGARPRPPHRGRHPDQELRRAAGTGPRVRFIRPPHVRGAPARRPLRRPCPAGQFPPAVSRAAACDSGGGERGRHLVAPGSRTVPRLGLPLCGRRRGAPVGRRPDEDHRGRLLRDHGHPAAGRADLQRGRRRGRPACDGRQRDGHPHRPPGPRCGGPTALLGRHRAHGRRRRA